MVQMTMFDAAKAMNGTVIRGDGAALFSGAVLDSRAVRPSHRSSEGTSEWPNGEEPGQLFFALEGATTDGHRFVEKALADGAAGAVVRAEPAPTSAGTVSAGVLIQVEDTYVALHDLTRFVREKTPQHLVAITGSAGKTTTKELLTAMLKTRFVTAPSPGNFNNLFGFPLALLSIPNDTQWMVAEMGMSTPGELGGVSELGKPEIGIFTNVRHAHVEAFEQARASGTGGEDVKSGEEMITDAKAELLQGLDPSALVIVNAEDVNTLEIARRHLARSGSGSAVEVASAGERSGRGLVGRGKALGFRSSRANRHEGADTQAISDAIENLGSDFAIPLEVEERSTSSEGHRFVLRDRARPGEEQEVFLPLHGAVNIENFLAAATCAHSLGVTLEQISRSVEGSSLPAGRGGTVDIGGALVIDDSYNSNPSALERALRAAADVARNRVEGRLWAVLGEMKELGSQSAEFHRDMGELAGALGYQRVVGVGEMAREILSGASAAGSKVRWYANAEDAQAVAKMLRAHDVVLVKGSRSVGLERVMEAFRSEQTAQPEQPAQSVLPNEVSLDQKGEA